MCTGQSDNNTLLTLAAFWLSAETLQRQILTMPQISECADWPALFPSNTIMWLLQNDSKYLLTADIPM